MVRSGAEHRHISAVIRKLCLKLGHFKETPANQSRFEFGNAFEEAVIHGLTSRMVAREPYRYAKIGELELDGLLGTPDLGDFVDEAMIEIKFSKLGSGRDPEDEKFWKFWVQLKAYCHMFGWKTGYLHIGHIFGNYDKGGDGSGWEEDYRVWGWTWTQLELERNWKMLVTNADPL
jgi:hypothetical protein